MDRMRELEQIAASIAGPLSHEEISEWHRLHIAPDWRKRIGIDVVSVRKDRLGYLDHQAADRYLDSTKRKF